MVLQAPSDNVPLRIIAQHLSNEELLLGKGGACDVVSDSILEKCTVVILNSKAMLLGGSRFVNCKVRPKRLVNASWNSTSWDGCDFRGRYLSTHSVS